MSLEELGETILTVRETAQADHPIPALSKVEAEAFAREFTRLVTALQQLDSTVLNGQPGEKIISELYALSTKFLGEEGVPFVLGYFVGAMGCSPMILESHREISPAQSRAVIRYLVEHPELYKQLSGIHD